MKRHRDALELGLLRQLRDMPPEGVSVIVLPDRGSGRTELARICQESGLRYVIVLCRQHGPVQQHVVIRWVERLPERRDESFLDDRSGA